MPHAYVSNLNGPTLRGIDVASPQGPTFDWQAAFDDGNAFAWIKATEGAGGGDPCFARNWREARERGVMRGPYHFLGMLSDPIVQAGFFLSKFLRDYRDEDLHPMVDIESDHGAPSSRMLDVSLRFVERVEAETGRPVVVYTYPSFWIERMKAPRGFALGERPLLISHFVVDPNNGRACPRPAPIVPDTWAAWDVWQTTGNKAYRVGGIETDTDVFFGTRDDFASRFTRRPPTIVAQLEEVAATPLRGGAGEKG